MNINVAECLLARDLQDAGQLSIIVQGGVFDGNIAQVANICEHWRRMFPSAELICSISSGDTLEFGSSPVRLAPRSHAVDSLLSAALASLTTSCDQIVFADAALPLPPIKIDTGLCNANLQIAAARKGLEVASGKYVLRVRNDFFFSTDAFIDQYAESYLIPRGEASHFEGRVMISQLFTLNPYGVERLPLHFSDWFHFGLLSDVRKIWKASDLTLADVTYYKYKPHAEGSTEYERRFLTRVAVEQHLIYECFKDAFPDLALDYHNDGRSADLSVQILLDNFVLCDVVEAGCVFDKYWNSLTNSKNNFFWCITRQQWGHLATNRKLSPKSILQTTRHELVTDANNKFPREYTADRLHSKSGAYIGREIVLTEPMKPGVLVFGPHVALPVGRYYAEVYITTLESKGGKFVIRATLGHGKIHLAEKVVRFGDFKTGPEILLFSNEHNDSGDFEIVVEVDGIYEMAVQKIVIHEGRPADK